jgi:hypothetical protein
MAYYVGTQQFPSIYEASRFLAQNPQPGATITSAPVAPAGMLTKPAPTTKQTAPVGTPSTPPKQMPGESGPFDPNAPVPTPAPAPAPAPAPQQTGPVGIPSSDPTKTQPGETGPFDPNAVPPALSLYRTQKNLHQNLKALLRLLSLKVLNAVMLTLTCCMQGVTLHR